MSSRIPPASKNWSKDARELWRSVHTDYLLATHHVVMLRQACELLTRADDARKQIAAVGLAVVDRYGNQIPNKLLETERQSVNGARLALRELGLDTNGRRADEQLRIHRAKGYA